MPQICIGKSPCELRRNAFFIIDIGIEETYRNSGYGSVLLTEIIKCAKQYNADRISGKLSCTDSKNADAREKLHHFYAKHGFIIDGSKLLLILK